LQSAGALKGSFPLVSIIMSMRNSAPTVGAAVRSVLMQTLHDWELTSTMVLPTGAARPDYVLILPWNLRQEIVQQINQIPDWAGQFIIPVLSL
jgi:C-methyltransferase-like protein